MTARLHDRELDALLADWLDEGPSTAADFVVEQAMARVPGVRRRGAGWWPQLPSLLRTQGPLLAILAVLTILGAGMALALGLIPPPEPPPNPPVLPGVSQTAMPSPSASAPGTARPVPKRGSFEISTPLGAFPSGRTWTFKGDIGGDGLASDGLNGYGFTTGWSGEGGVVYSVVIYLDPQADYFGAWDTTRSDLAVSLSYYINTNDSMGQLVASGAFVTVADECIVSFEEYEPTVARGSLNCVDVPGTYNSRADPERREGTADIVGTFAFDPSFLYLP